MLHVTWIYIHSPNVSSYSIRPKLVFEPCERMIEWERQKQRLTMREWDTERERVRGRKGWRNLAKIGKITITPFISIGTSRACRSLCIWTWALFSVFSFFFFIDCMRIVIFLYVHIHRQWYSCRIVDAIVIRNNWNWMQNNISDRFTISRSNKLVFQQNNTAADWLNAVWFAWEVFFFVCVCLSVVFGCMYGSCYA